MKIISKETVLLFLLVLTAGVLYSLGTPSQASAGYYATTKECPHSKQTGIKPAIKERALRCMINHARKSKRKEKLSFSTSLEKTAERRTRRMISCDWVYPLPCKGDQFNSYYEYSGYADDSWSAQVLVYGEEVDTWEVKYTTANYVFWWLSQDSSYKDVILSPSWEHLAVDIRKGTVGRTTNMQVFSIEFGAGGKKSLSRDYTECKRKAKSCKK